MGGVPSPRGLLRHFGKRGEGTPPTKIRSLVRVISREAEPTVAAEATALVAIQLEFRVDCLVATLLAMTSSGPRFVFIRVYPCPSVVSFNIA